MSCKVYAQFLCVFTLLVLTNVPVVHQSYAEQRKEVLYEELKMSVGGDTVLNKKESQVNDILMSKKKEEIQNSQSREKPFPPNLHFFQAKTLIEQSDVFKIIKMMPKGGVLHVHDESALSVDWLVKNVTYRDRCFMCYKEPSRIQFRFLKEAPKDPDCVWTLVNDNRKISGNPSLFDQWLYSNLTLTVNDPAKAYPSEDIVWKQFEGALKAATGLILYAPVFKDYIYRALKEFSEDNVQYMELRALMSQAYELDGSLLPELWTLETYRNVSRQFVEDQSGTFSGMKVIYSDLRRKNASDIASSIKKALQYRSMFPDFVVGYDLVGQEDKGHPLYYFIEELLQASQAQNPSLPFFFHAGETNWQGTPVDENLVDAVLLNASRIGHGYALVKHPWLMEMVYKKGIALEVNPISNQVLKLVDDLRNHPASAFIARGLPVVISSDDGSVWGAKGLSYDFYEAFMGLSGDRNDLRLLKQLAINSLRYSAMSKGERKAALELWQSKWEKFLDEVLVQFSKP